MDNLLTVTFEAHNDERNHHRRYSIRIGRDLLNDWTVTIGHGRTGHAGQETRFASPQADDIKTIINDRLGRRVTAPKRIGCVYRLASLDFVPSFDATEWLPELLMDNF